MSTGRRRLWISGESYRKYRLFCPLSRDEQTFYTPCIRRFSDTRTPVTHSPFNESAGGVHYPLMAMPAQALATAPVPPQNLDAEESVLGAMMLSPLAIGAVTESTNISAADFYRESHGRIYKAILALYAKGDPVDAITVVDELDRAGTLDAVGGADRVHELAALVPAASNAAHYARIVSEMATLRGLIRAGNDIARLSPRSVAISLTMRA